MALKRTPNPWKRCESSCRCCGSIFRQLSPNHLYCCDRCASAKSQRLCAWCGKSFVPHRLKGSRGFTACCSSRCARFKQHHNGTSVPVAYASCTVCRSTYVVRSIHRRHCQGRPAYFRYKMVCVHCGVLVEPPSQCCDSCRRTVIAVKRKAERKAGKRRRRARLKSVEFERFDDEEIFERDQWRCQLCKRRVLPNRKVPHPRAPTLDHIVPIAHDGPHTRANVQCACFECNWRKADGVNGQGEQLRLVG